MDQEKVDQFAIAEVGWEPPTWDGDAEILALEEGVFQMPVN